jgi:hypothetical protein
MRSLFPGSTREGDPPRDGDTTDAAVAPTRPQGGSPFSFAFNYNAGEWRIEQAEDAQTTSARVANRGYRETTRRVAR